MHIHAYGSGGKSELSMYIHAKDQEENQNCLLYSLWVKRQDVVWAKINKSKKKAKIQLNYLKFKYNYI